jgi:MarR family 2-MHQ and catechol resistance regulon transcriptional repressor
MLRQLVQIIRRQLRTGPGAAALDPPVALNQQELHVVEFLGGHGSQMMRAVAEHALLAVNTMTSIVDGLEQKGLVQRCRSSEDRRQVLVQLTRQGEDIWKTVEQARQELYCSLLSPLSLAEQQTFLDYFRKIAQVDAPGALGTRRRERRTQTPSR